MTAKKSEVASARQLRRHYALLSKVAEKALSIGYNVQTARNEIGDVFSTVNLMRGELLAFRAEVGERLRMIELELEAIGTVVPTLPRWTKEQRQAFENGDTDRKIASGLKHEQNLMERV